MLKITKLTMTELLIPLDCYMMLVGNLKPEFVKGRDLLYKVIVIQ